MRPLTECPAPDCTAQHTLRKRDELERNRIALRQRFHSQCMFNGNPITRGLEFRFRDNGSLTALFTLGPQHTGYDNVAHGGVIAAIIDASMAQCLMGHGIVGYTVDLAIKYRKPLRIGLVTRLETRTTGTQIRVLQSLRTDIWQGRTLVVNATGRFYPINGFHQKED